MNIKILNLIKPALLLALSVILILLCLGLLEDHDYILVNYSTLPSYSQYDNIKNRYAKDAAPFSRSAGITIHTEFRNVPDTTVYSCDEQFKAFMILELVSGSFLENDDVRQNNSFVVIDENIAVLLFSNTDCIGRSIYIQEKEFEVIGVVGAKDGAFDKLIAVDRYCVYVPYASMGFPNSFGGCVYRADNPIAVNAIAGQAPYSFGFVQNIVSISMRAKTVAMIGRLALFAMWVIALIFVLRVGITYLANFAKQTKEKLGAQYLTEYLRKHWLTLTLHALAIALISTLFVLWLRLVRFQPEADPALVPQNLFSLRDWSNTITEYVLTTNTRASVPFSPSILIDKIKLILLAAGFAAVFSTTRLLSLLRDAFGARNTG